MILDLHTHSIKSDDGRAKVENYCQWIRKKELPLDGFVLTEHRQFDGDSDYTAIADQYGLVILKGSEVDVVARYSGHGEGSGARPRYTARVRRAPRS